MYYILLLSWLQTKFGSSVNSSLSTRQLLQCGAIRAGYWYLFGRHLSTMQPLRAPDTATTPRWVNLPVFRSVAVFSLLYDLYNSQLLPARDTVITIVNYVIIIIIITFLCSVTFIDATTTSGILCRSHGLKNFLIAHALLRVLPTTQLLIKKQFTFLCYILEFHGKVCIRFPFVVVLLTDDVNR
jgi:hypothetical protein